MVSIPERRTSKAAGWSRRTAAFSAVLLLTDFAGHRFDLVETPVFLWVLGIVAPVSYTHLTLPTILRV